MKQTLLDVKNFSTPYVIAEISSNHHQSFGQARVLVEEAAKAGASAVKFQAYTAGSLTLDSRSADFMISEGPWQGRSMYELYESSEMDWKWNSELKLLCEDLGIEFLSSVFDHRAVDSLVACGANGLKIASFEMVDLGLISYAASTGLPIIISTGLASKSEIQEAVAAASKAEHVSLMHCISSYPAEPSRYSLGTIKDLALTFGIPVGVSDHTQGVGVAAASVTVGAPLFEKHFTLDRSGDGSDDFFSADVEMFRNYVTAISDAFACQRGPDYSLVGQEKFNLRFRRSLYFVADVSQGSKITESDVRSVRPGLGLSPKFLPEIIGKTLKVSVNKGTRVTFDVLEEL